MVDMLTKHIGNQGFALAVLQPGWTDNEIGKIRNANNILIFAISAFWDGMLKIRRRKVPEDPSIYQEHRLAKMG